MIQDTPIQKTLCFLSIIWLYSLGHYLGGSLLLGYYVATIRLWPTGKPPIKKNSPPKAQRPEDLQ